MPSLCGCGTVIMKPASYLYPFVRTATVTDLSVSFIKEQAYCVFSAVYPRQGGVTLTRLPRLARCCVHVLTTTNFELGLKLVFIVAAIERGSTLSAIENQGCRMCCHELYLFVIFFVFAQQ